MLIKRGDIFYADLNPVVGSEQGGIRPVLVVQNNVGNKYSPTLVVLPISTAKKHYLPTHIHICGSKTLPKDSVVLAILWQKYLQISLMKFLKLPKNRISITRILKIYTVSSRLQGMQRRRDWDVSRIFNWLACRRYRWSNHNVSLHSSRTSG